MSALQVEPFSATFGACVTGVDLATDLAAHLAAQGDEAFAEIHAAFLEYAVLVFPGQHLSPAAQVAFARRFGEIEHLFGEAGYVPISNQRADGTLLQVDHPAYQVMRGNEGWHTDSSYMPVSARASVLSAQVVPPAGGQTEWADMRAAHSALAPALRERVEKLEAYHSIRYSQARIGYTDPSPGGYGFDVDEPPRRPLVKIHPETGRAALYIGRHAHAIPGLAAEASLALLDDLLAFACQPPRVAAHAWVPGDVVVWDNRCVLHRARPYAYDEPRVMRHTRIAGDPVTEAAL